MSHPSRLVLLGVFVAAFLLVAGGCSGSTASYTRARRAMDEGHMVRAEEVRAADFIAYHASEDAPRPATTAGPILPVLLDARLGTNVVPTAGGRALVQVSLRGGTAAVRTPSRIVIVVDVSGSMQEGDKIGAVRHALARFVEVLDPADELAIVTFSDTAHVALPPSSVASSRDVILSAVGALSAYGGTNLDAGLATGLSLAASMRTTGSTTRLVFLSDGMASIGVTDPTTLAAYGDQARALDVSVTTVGMGSAIDFALLEAVANRSGGAFHYLDRPSEVERVFAEDLCALVSLAARDVRVRVRLPSGIELLRSFDERTRYAGDVLETPIGDLGSDEASVMVFELLVPPGGGVLSIPVEITLAGPDGGATVVATTALDVVRGEGTAAFDASVLRNATLGRLAVALREASARTDAGRADEAWVILSAAIEESRAAQAALMAAGEEEKARSLDEALRMATSARSLLPAPAAPPVVRGWTITTSPTGSSSFAGWR